MNAKPWYQSVTIYALAVAIVTKILMIAGVGDGDEAAAGQAAGDIVAQLLPFVGILCDLIAAWGRKRASGPVTLTKAKAEEISGDRNDQAGFARVSLLSALATTLVVVLMLAACAPQQVKPTAVLSTACAPADQYQIERCAEAVGDVYEVYLARALEIVRDPLTPPDVKATLQKLDRELTPAVRALVQTSAAYVHLRDTGAPPAAIAAKREELSRELAAVEPKVRTLPQL